MLNNDLYVASQGIKTNLKINDKKFLNCLKNIINKHIAKNDVEEFLSKKDENLNTIEKVVKDKDTHLSVRIGKLIDLIEDNMDVDDFLKILEKNIKKAKILKIKA